MARRDEDVLPIAGGTALMPQIINNTIDGKTLLGIGRLDELKGISLSGDVVKIGALTTVAQLKISAVIKQYLPALADAAAVFADPLVCNSATVGGNIAAASPATDMLPPLLACDAAVVLAYAGGQRQLPLADFFSGYNQTVKRADELITQLLVPVTLNSAFIKLGLRNAMAISVATAAVAVTVDDKGVIGDCRIALGAVAPTVVRAFNTEGFLLGQKLSDKLFAQMYDILQQDISPISDIRAAEDYRRQAAPVIVRRALLQAAARGQKGGELNG